MRTYVDVDSRGEQAQDMGQGKDDSKEDSPSEETKSEECDVEGDEDDAVDLVLFGVPCVTAEDESHYITTHEIQLSELSDHEGDNDVGVDWEDNQVFSFVDYDDYFGENTGKVANDKPPASPHVSSGQPQPQPQPQQQQQIHLSIRTRSQTGGDNLVYHGDVSGYLFRGVDGDAAKCFIAAPGRVHFGLRAREVTDSSGTSSAVSELDDADKEVRNLTAKAFKSLAYPYFDTINFSTSSESSASDKWSAFVDLKYGNVDKGLENRGFTGFTLNGNPPTQLGFVGTLGQGHSGVIRLTETLNFRCNVGVAGAERPPMFAQSATAVGSRSKDEVTNAGAGGRQWRLGATTNPPCQKTMEHKKAIFASSLIKNVISKKIQFETERKMERGEISEPNAQEDSGRASKKDRELVRQSSKFSESSSDLAIMCVDELGDLVDSGSCDTKSDRTHRKESLALETNLEQANEAGIDTKKGAMDASKGTLLRSQNSAFRCWKDEEVEFQKDRKSVQENALEANDNVSNPSGVKLRKMSSLFVPSIQLLSGEDSQQNSSGQGDEGGVKARSDNVLLVSDSRSLTAKSPEIKINLRSGKNEPFGVTRLRAPNIGCSRTEDYKSLALAAALRGECSDKVPHFMVRDIRDNKGKLQTPIHQVRDVRKLVKSSYHFVSLDNSDNKTTVASADIQTEGKKQAPGRNSASVSPIVIKCQSVNTNNNDKPTESVTDLSKREDFERSSPEGAKGAPLKPPGKASSSDAGAGFKIESRVAAWKPEKDILDKKTDKVTSQVALEKLQAAVKTMEQLYVFEKNEWKRKNEPNPVTDSHVLPLIATEEQDKALGKDSNCENVESRVRSEELLGHSNSSIYEDRFNIKAMKAEHQATKSPYGTKAFTPKSPKVPTSMRTTQRKLSGQDRADSKEEECSYLDQAISDHENYLTIPVKPASKPAPEASSVYTYKARTPPGTARPIVQPVRDNPPASVVMETPETPSAAMYHSLPMGITTNQVYCFSPAVTPAPTLDHFQPTQRKMLLDPTTGSYYLVDTPVQPTSKRLFDPETGQYVDVPLPQPPMTPMPMSPLALSPGAYAHTYMIYPGFMSPTVIPARTLVPSQMSVHSDPPDKVPLQQSETPYMESPYYMATGKSPQTARPTASRTPQGYSALKQPFISITAPQQGPRIIAPPSFDGTTMSFVVEHR